MVNQGIWVVKALKLVFNLYVSEKISDIDTFPHSLKFQPMKLSPSLLAHELFSSFDVLFRKAKKNLFFIQRPVKVKEFRDTREERRIGAKPFEFLFQNAYLLC